MARWQPNHGKEQPSLLAFIDTETNYESPATANDPGRHRFRLACGHFCQFRDGAETVTQRVPFARIEDFWRVLVSWSQPKKVLWVYAHNIMFDLWVLGFPERIESGYVELTNYSLAFRSESDEEPTKRSPWKGLCSIDRDTVIIHTKCCGRRINFVDSANYFRSTVASIGESIGLPKFNMPRFEASDSEWYTYCWRDVDIIRKAVTGLMREWRVNDIGNWQPTIASLAYSAYRHRFMSTAPVGHEEPAVSELEHDAYFDGRTQPYFVGDIRDKNAGGSNFGSPLMPGNRPWIDGPIYCVDIQGMYPSVMSCCDYPYRAMGSNDYEPTVIANLSLPSLADNLGDYACISSVQIESENDYYPCRRDGSVRYPVGRFTTTLATPEILLALKLGHIKRVNWVIFYHKAKLFERWVSYWWERRQHYKRQDNLVGAELCKLVLNSLAGKFAQKNRQWVNTIDHHPRDPWDSWVHHDAATGETISLRSIGWSVQRLVDSGYSPHALVAVSAHVNSYARIQMLEYRLMLPSRSVLYQGNDSLLVTEEGYSELCNRGLVVAGELGRFQLQGVANTAAIFAARDYEFSGEIRKAGLPRNARAAGYRRWEVDRFEDSASLLARPPDGTVHVRREIVRATGPAMGGLVGSDGFVLPPRLWE